MKAAVLCAALVAAAAAPFRTFPLYKQCNSSWGGNQMGTNGNGERSTICGEGCAMTSLSMVLAGTGISINGQTATPATFNAWLMANNGYTCIDGDCNNLVLGAVTNLTSSISLVGEQQKPTAAAIQAGLVAGNTFYIAHVHNNGHFVLLTGYDPTVPDVFWVNDPFYNSTTYPYANITDIIVYSWTPGTGTGNTRNVRRHAPKTTMAVANPRAVRVVPRAGAAFMTPADVAPAAPMPAGSSSSSPVSPHASGSPVIPFQYPLYKQCDSRWGNQLMQTETICSVGCLMSSTSMAIAGKNITIGRNASNPSTLNYFLQTHNGYVGDNDMDEAAVPAINPSRIQWPSDGMHTTNDIPLATIQGYLKAGRPVIAWVMDKQHFVLVIGWDAATPDTLYINDPGFDRATYSYSQDVVGWRLFDME